MEKLREQFKFTKEELRQKKFELYILNTIEEKTIEIKTKIMALSIDLKLGVNYEAFNNHKAC